jgi:hypothetical protein
MSGNYALQNMVRSLEADLRERVAQLNAVEMGSLTPEHALLMAGECLGLQITLVKLRMSEARIVSDLLHALKARGLEITL